METTLLANITTESEKEKERTFFNLDKIYKVNGTEITTALDGHSIVMEIFTKDYFTKGIEMDMANICMKMAIDTKGLGGQMKNQGSERCSKDRKEVFLECGATIRLFLASMTFKTNKTSE